MNRFFHSELDTLKSHLMLMGEKALTALSKSVEALEEFDLELAKEVIDSDDEIDDLEIEIDREATRYLTLRAPVASDLRLLTVAIKASHDLERVGDEAHTIAKRTRKLIVKSGCRHPLLDIPRMAEIAEGMLRDSLYCFFQEEPEKAFEILKTDAQVDEMDKSNIKQLISMAKQDSSVIYDYIDLIFISKALERIADHATNLAEEVIFLTTGKEARHQDL